MRSSELVHPCRTRASYLAMRLHRDLDARPAPKPKAPASSPAPRLDVVAWSRCVDRARSRFDGLAANATLEAILEERALLRLPLAARRNVLDRLTDAAALHRTLEALGLAAHVAPNAVRAWVEVNPDLDALVALWSTPGYRQLGAARQERLVRALATPTAGDTSWGGHAVHIAEWWSPIATRFATAFDGADAPEHAATHLLHHPSVPIYALEPRAFPGVFGVCLGEPATPTSLSFVRVFFVDEEGRLQVGVKSPIEQIRDGTSPNDRPVDFDVRRWTLSIAETRALVRWLEDNHVISGPDGLLVPQTQGTTTFGAMMQLDLTFVRMVERLTAGRGGAPVRFGTLRNGVVSLRRP